ncbi:hypothetical protein [uncultured Adlercreutzia sp.]|uniref:hypothetical protein n=1 Tax=uncultured Adlercreutzia sp. TaxID=875803 RepID=UPI0025DB34A2|nr:hypothetical protein [uncultured Adlercreutzia sp.]MCI9262511.1 hypothetical protein [Eggerthellaceae bacterium]
MNSRPLAQATAHPIAQAKIQRVLSLLFAGLLALSLAVSAGCADLQPVNDAPEANTPAAATSHLTFRNAHALEEHFEKHGAEMGCATADEYLASANAVIANPKSLHKLQAEDGDDLYFLERTGEFVVVSSKGFIRTYFITDRDYYDRQ